MLIYYFLIKMDPFASWLTYDEIHSIKELEDIHTLFGNYDFIGKVQAETEKEIQGLRKRIEEIPGIKDIAVLNGL